MRVDVKDGAGDPRCRVEVPDIDVAPETGPSVAVVTEREDGRPGVAVWVQPDEETSFGRHTEPFGLVQTRLLEDGRYALRGQCDAVEDVRFDDARDGDNGHLTEDEEYEVRAAILNWEHRWRWENAREAAC